MKGSSTTSSSSRPFVPEDLDAHREEDEGAGVAGPASTNARCGRGTKQSRSSTQRGEPLKVQLIEEKTDGQRDVSCYTIKDRDTFVDFCVGPHVPSTGRLKAFKLLHTSNAYWKGDAQNQPMQRIYGTAFFKDEELKQHLKQIEEAKKRDHRRLGRSSGSSRFIRGRRARRSGSARAPRSTTRSRTTCGRCCSRPATWK